MKRLVVTALVIVAISAAVRPVEAQEASALEFDATLDGIPLDDIDANDPLELRPGEELPIEIDISNGTDEELFVRGVRLDSKVLGLTFFTFTTRIDARIDAGNTVTRSFLVDLGDLGDQAVGLLPASLTLIDEERAALADGSFPVDVRGSLTSVYGLFGIIVALITALLLGAALVRLAGHRLPANRWSRAARFGIPGFGVGMTLTFTLSALRLLTPSAPTWLAAVVVCGAIGLVVGYLSPDPRDEGDDDQLIRELLSEYHARERERERVGAGSISGATSSIPSFASEPPDVAGAEESALHAPAPSDDASLSDTAAQTDSRTTNVSSSDHPPLQ